MARFTHTRSRSGLRWFLVIVIAVGAALWWRFRGKSSSEQQQPPRQERISTPALADARASTVVAVDASIAVDPVEHVKVDLSTQKFALERLSNDGKRALLFARGEVGETPELREVMVETGEIQAKVELASFRVPPIDEPEQPKDPARRLLDLTRARALLAGFPLGASEIIASSPDGTRGAFNEGDPLWTVARDKLTKVKLPAAYTPLILPDGKTLLFRGYAGEVDGPGTGKYGWCAMQLDGGKPVEIAGTEDASSLWAVDANVTALRTIVQTVPDEQRCVIEVPLVKPLRVSRRHCFAKSDSLALSPHGDRVVVTTMLDAMADSTIGPREKSGQRIRVIDIATGASGLDVIASGIAIVSDRGDLVLQQRDDTYAVIGGSAKRAPLDMFVLRCRFRGDTELVCVRDGTVELVELAGASRHAQ